MYLHLYSYYGNFSYFISYQLAIFVFRLSRGGGRAGSRGAGGEGRLKGREVSNSTLVYFLGFWGESRIKGREVNTLTLWRFWNLGDFWLKRRDVNLCGGP